jgi:hypothetical protein
MAAAAPLVNIDDAGTVSAAGHLATQLDKRIIHGDHLILNVNDVSLPARAGATRQRNAVERMLLIVSIVNLALATRKHACDPAHRYRQEPAFAAGSDTIAD